MIMYEKEFIDFLQKMLEIYNISEVTCDSRLAKNRSLFFAIKGIVNDGNDFLEEVLEKGSICFTDDLDRESENVYLVWDTRKAIAVAASMLYPAMPDNIVAVTGTNGKTSAVNYFMQICAHAGFKSASIGTIGVSSLDPEIQEYFDQDEYRSLTSPDPVKFYKIVNKLAEFGVTHLAFEASSHGLDQVRAYGIKLAAAAFTSFSQDHLDYHGDMDNYLESKLKITSMLDGSKLFIPSDINRIEDIKKSYDSVSIIPEFEILESSIKGQKVKSGDLLFKSNIISNYQISNLMLAVSLAIECSIKRDSLKKILPKITAVSGRLERVDTRDLNIFIDYSHTPDALEKALSELRKYKFENTKLIVVFGCGGDRDSDKRPLMGKVALDLSDIAIVTDDNPRTESPYKIRKEIISSMEGFIEISDREKAIHHAIDITSSNDIILIAGKGHENYQIIGEKKIEFCDKNVALNYCKLKYNIIY